MPWPELPGFSLTSPLRVWAGGLLLLAFSLAGACGSGQPRSGADAAPLDAGPPSVSGHDFDRDGDGLCNGSEQDLRTDPDDADSDGDGLSDSAELAGRFDPSDATSPDADQVGVLPAVTGATLELAVRTTVSGTGEALTGHFEPQGALDGSGTAADFFDGAEVVSVDPLDNVRAVEAQTPRFGVVVGETRLGFSLRFTYRQATARSCTGVYPFRYALRSGTGELAGGRAYLLLVAPRERVSGPFEPCLPEICL